jgi:hypothetical protein
MDAIVIVGLLGVGSNRAWCNRAGLLLPGNHGDDQSRPTLRFCEQSAQIRMISFLGVLE